MRVLLFILSLLSTVAAAQTNQYLFIGHTRSDFQSVVWPLEHVQYDAYATLMLGGDYLWDTSANEQSMRYMDSVFDLDRPETLIAFGNHDDASRTRFRAYTGRALAYTYQTNGMYFIVLDTEEDPGDIPPGQLAMIDHAVNNVTNISAIVLVKHRILWMVNNVDLAHLMPQMAATTQSLGSSNWFSDVHPLLVQAEQAGIEVVCLAGDRTDVNVEYARDGVTYLASGIKEEFPPTNNFVVTLTQDVGAGTLTHAFNDLTELPTTFPPIVISEIHFQPGSPQVSGHEFVELYNFGRKPYDLNGCAVISGVGFSFTNSTILAPGGFLVLARDASMYSGLSVPVLEWEAGNNLDNSRDAIVLVDPAGKVLDAVAFDNKTGGTDTPWQREPFGGGPTLALLDAHEDNVWSRNWRSSEQDGGTPGAPNFVLPVLERVALDGGAVVSRWASVETGVDYALEASPSLKIPQWQELGVYPASFNTLSLTNAPGIDSTSFYRLRRIFP
ncbi:MAG: hypothetical protein ACI9TH_001139 [Kiritimatiellia bacterium]|jgi:hypothetical protein